LDKTTEGSFIFVDGNDETGSLMIIGCCGSYAKEAFSVMAEGRVKGMVVLSREPIRYTNDMQLRRKKKTQASLHFRNCLHDRSTPQALGLDSDVIKTGYPPA
jgi:hypothetical protein